MARVEVKVPQLSESVTEATMLPWKKKAGDAVTQDEILVELETDKVVLEVPAPASGVLAKIVKKEGDIVHADELLAAIDTEAKASAAPAPAPAPAPAKTEAPAPASSPAPAPVPAPAASGKPADFDVIVIGSGPGGYIAAIRAAQLGKKVACVEEWINHAGKPKLGGTCLNVGCIPSKALLASSEQFEKAKMHFDELGITMDNLAVDVDKMVKRKEGIVEKITGGVEFLFRKNKIIWLKGHGKLAGKDGGNFKVEVSGDGKSETHSAQYVIVATGSKARHLPNVPVDNKIVSDNEGALAFDAAPKKLAVIGAGVIGLELGSVWRRLGAEVTILEALPDFLGTTDASLQKEAAKLFKKQGLTIHLGVKIDNVKATDKSVSISYKDKDGNAQTLDADRLIVSIGRVPNTDNLGLDSIGLATDERGFIPVDGHCATKVPNVYAIGDVVRGPMLAHKAEDEGVLVAEIIDGQKPHIDYNCIPWVIYTHPEIAWVGQTEQALKAEGRAFKTGQFPMLANGRAMGIGETDGFIKVIADAQTDEILGVHIISANASDLIAEAVVAMEFKAASEDIGRICHPHPSLSEVMREAALAVDKRALNI
ncbi:Dihydrolipoamide dehydrogenase of 2-oxoglutarate dehydrogenase [Candidatus Burkholderia verschuerenii]|uniref:Dihydrolipoyl dehydrogenase n=1 Tax=Candidatus Burkholderia verschuerenii TaxID=242163 RepID=A0A0L0MFS8_9BURK|nr:dihydrolipoyl dehydrogenase [Candidatus Burkholderia verschuerenii]KND60829.1 Dihydrolipoamide dehydrogenase of 2-oxoglutarate dehydrogenase [Candidatus Burkholderia verschuerenii]